MCFCLARVIVIGTRDYLKFFLISSFLILVEWPVQDIRK